ncbi:MAG: spore maturation protein B [Candidatus Improbicoccus devescovinae]|nr:MAG: spore maturation protein B [Candidatus Improbicoccus devescovinae]
MLGAWAIPIVILIILIFAVIKHVPIFDSFVAGAKYGMEVTYSITPSLIALITSVTMLNASGALDIFTSFITPFTNFLKFPAELVPLSILKPISGSASTAIFDNILKKFGADSQLGRTAALIMGSTETTFYTIAVYFGSIGLKNIKNTLALALIADFVALVVSVLMVNLIWA